MQRVPLPRLSGWVCTVLLAFCAMSSSSASAAPVPGWDLSYQTVLKAHPVGPDEFLPIWIERYPKRPVHQKMNEYTGEAIEASLLIEEPDGHAGDPMATWVIKTNTSAKLCKFHEKFMDNPCQPLDPARTEQFIRDVLKFEPLPPQTSQAKLIGKLPDGRSILLNYIGFLSVWIDGVATQRPLASMEQSEGINTPGQQVPSPHVGRMARAIAKLLLTDDEFNKRQTEIEQSATQQLVQQAAESGDIKTIGQLLDRGVPMEANLQDDSSLPMLAIAAGNGQTRLVDFLLTRGANINAKESSAMKAAVQAKDIKMLEHLLAKGARIDPPKDSIKSRGSLFQSPLGLAVDKGMIEIARWLIRKGANVNIQQSRPIIATASKNLDFPMVDLLLRHGANPNQPVSELGQTAIMSLMSQSGDVSGWPKEAERQQEIFRTEARIEKIVRRLVASGANVNYTNAACNTAYWEADAYNSEGMKKLLTELGAIPDGHQQCEKHRAQHQP
jgi:ankyrin repeat protein